MSRPGGQPARIAGPAMKEEFMLRRSLLVAAMGLMPVGLVAAPVGMAVASAAATRPPASCSGVIQITSLAFTPPAVPPGGTSTANMIARNCTGATQRASVLWLGRFVGSGSGIPPGCPAIDPLPPAQVTFTPHGRVRASLGYFVPVSCMATQLQVTVVIEQGATVVAQRTADLTIIH
jgi:hypothetical protein